MSNEFVWILLLSIRLLNDFQPSWRFSLSEPYRLKQHPFKLTWWSLWRANKLKTSNGFKWHMPGIWGIHNPFLAQLRWYQPQLWTKSLGNTYCKVSSKLIAITSFHSIDSTMEWKEKPPESPWNTELRVNKAFAKGNHLLVCCFT